MHALFVAAGLLIALWPWAAAPDTPGDFDHYVLSLSWHPAWCAREGDDRDAPTCEVGARRAFTVHGLWPQHEQGWPEFCRATARDPSRRETATMADLMGSGGLAWYQWRKHGRCSGLDGPAYLQATRAAAEAVRIPPGFARIAGPVRLGPETVAQAFLAANPALDPEGVIVTCRDGQLHEVRICLDRSLQPQACTDQQESACRSRTLTIPPVR
jgi:ribonuclease T2